MRVVLNRTPQPSRQDWLQPSVAPPPADIVIPAPAAFIPVRSAVYDLIRSRYEIGRCSRDDFRKADAIASEAEEEIGEYVDDNALGWEKLSSWLGARDAVS